MTGHIPTGVAGADGRFEWGGGRGKGESVVEEGAMAACRYLHLFGRAGHCDASGVIGRTLRSAEFERLRRNLASHVSSRTKDQLLQ